MKLRDLLLLALGTILALRSRSFLTALGIAVGSAAVILLTSIGEGAHRFLLSEFTQFGTHLVAVNPGKTTTFGVSGALFGTVRPLTLDDCEALRRLRHVTAVVPVVQGNAEVEGGGRRRRTSIYGVGPDVPKVWRFRAAAGRFLPHESDPHAARPLAVLGAKVRRELFGDGNPLGQRIRVGGNRYTITGVVEPKGQLLGFDLDDAVYVPAARALELFDREGLMEIDVLCAGGASTDEVVAGIRRIVTARHGKDDITITTQQQMLDVLGNVLGVITFAVGALGGISLLVGGIGILTVQTIALHERTHEIGLLKALGAERAQILALFLTEAVVISAIGGLAGLTLGVGGAHVLGLAVPALPVHTPWTYVLLAEGVAVTIGLLAGVLPARRAAGLNAVESLRAE